MITEFKIFENLNLIPKFYIDIRNCSDEEKMKALSLLEKNSKIRFNGESSKEDFINYEYHLRPWAWIVKHQKGWFNDPSEFYMGAMFSTHWSTFDIGKRMIPCKEFIQIGIENVEMYFTSNKYNL